MDSAQLSCLDRFFRMSADFAKFFYQLLPVFRCQSEIKRTEHENSNGFSYSHIALLGTRDVGSPFSLLSKETIRIFITKWKFSKSSASSSIAPPYNLEAMTLAGLLFFALPQQDESEKGENHYRRKSCLRNIQFLFFLYPKRA